MIYIRRLSDEAEMIVICIECKTRNEFDINTDREIICNSCGCVISIDKLFL